LAWRALSIRLRLWRRRDAVSRWRMSATRLLDDYSMPFFPDDGAWMGKVRVQFLPWSWLPADWSWWIGMSLSRGSWLLVVSARSIIVVCFEMRNTVSRSIA
jgi:hypothetical protein